MGSIRTWIFRVLVLAAGAVWLYAWLSPWWTVQILQLGKEVATIRPWGLILDNVPKEYMSLVREAPMPGWFAPAMWAFLGITMAALLLAALFRDVHFRLLGIKFNLNRMVIAAVGFAYLTFIVGFLVVATIRAAGFWDTPLQGTYFIRLSESEYSDAVSQLLPGFYTASIAGPLLMLLALLRPIIAGKPARVRRPSAVGMPAPLG